MASIPLAEVITIGESMLGAKRYIMAFAFLWIWDYALTFGDEVNYIWKGRKSRGFILYLLNRYCALPYVVWVLSIVASWWPGSSREACKWTVFLETLYFNFATLFAQTILTLRVYVVTGENTFFTAVLICVTLAQFLFGCYVWMQIFTLGARVWPAIDLDSLRVCFSNEPEIHQVVLLTFSLVYDLLAFLMVVWVGCKSGGSGRPKFPMILDKIVKDATVYFLVMFTSHLLVEFFVLFAPRTYHFLPASSNVIFISIMATRMMLSLRKATDRPCSSTSVEDLDTIAHIVFAGEQTTTEHAMEVGS